MSVYKYSNSNNVVFTTAFTPFGNGEVFTLNEIYLLIKNGVPCIVVPRTYGKNIIHEQGNIILEKTLNFRLLSIQNFLILLEWIFSKPIKLFKLIIWSWLWSWNPSEFIKSLVVLPKALRVAQELSQYKISHIHCTNTNTMAIIAYVTSQVCQVPWSFTLHSWWPSLAARRSHFEIMLESATFCRVISEHACLELKKHISSHLHNKCLPIHIGVEISSKPCSRIPANGVYTIITPAVLQRHKGQSVAIDACRILIDEGVRNFKWIFYGEGTDRLKLENLISSYNLNKYVELPGTISNERLLKSYSQGLVQIVSIPSIELFGQPEGISHALIQAAGYGIPIVSTDSGGTTELTGNGAGITVPQNNPEALANAINQLITNDSYFYAQSNAAWTKAYSDFNSEVISVKLQKMFIS